MSLSDLPEFETNCEDEIVARPEEIEPDKRLLNWESCLAQRRELHEKFESRLKRPKAKLLINASEDRKEFDEKRRMIEHARIPAWDKYRGNPTGFTVPAMLAKACPGDLEYRATKSLIEKGIAPEIEFVKVPDVIAEEKDVVFNRSLYDLNKSEYFKEMIEQERVLEMHPHKPDLSEVIVIGKSLINDDEDDVKEKKTKRRKKSSVVNDEDTSSEEKGNDYILALNDLRLYADESETRVLKIFMESSPGEIEFSYVSIHNNSDTALRFLFLKRIKTMVLGKVVEDNRCALFFYNKNTHVLQPGETIDFSIGFKSVVCGIFTRILIMKIKPNPFHNIEIIIEVHVNVTSKDFNTFCANITEFLENGVRAGIIEDTFKSLLKEIPPKKSEIITYSYDRKAIFEAVNADYVNDELFVKYCYDKKVVDKLEDFYANTRLENHPEVWDYRIETLRAVTKQRENYENALKLKSDLNDLFVKIEECKLKRKQLEESLRVLWGGGVLKSSVYRAKVTKDDKKIKGFDNRKSKQVVYVEPSRIPLSRTLSDDLEDIVGKLKGSDMGKNGIFHKTQLCFPLVCACFDRISTECAELEFIFGITRANQQEIKKIPTFIHSESKDKLSDCKIVYPNTYDLIYNSNDKPAPPWSATIPLENFEARFYAFKMGKTTPVKTTATRATSQAFMNSDPLEEESICKEETEIPAHLEEHYRNNLHVIFNINLWKLIDDISSAVELLIPENSIKLQNLEIVGFAAHQDLGKDENLERIYDLKKAINQVYKFESQDDQENDFSILPTASPSIMDLIKIYGKQTIKGIKEEFSIYDQLFSFGFNEGMDAAVMTSPSIDIPVEFSAQDNEGICGDSNAGASESFECICKRKSNASFQYYDSELGFDVVASLSSGMDIQGCDKEL